MNRKTPKIVFGGIVLLVASSVPAQLQIVPPEIVQTVFSGKQRQIQLVLRNPSDAAVEASVKAKLLQLTSSTAAPVAEVPWKKIRVLGNQVIQESASIDFPDVRAGTRFVLRWTDEQSRQIGTTEMLVYPPDLLKELKTFLGDTPAGVFDPQNELKPLLKAVAIESEDVERSEIEHYEGKLLIVGPFAAREQLPPRLGVRLKSMRAKGVAVVWIQPPQRSTPPTDPSYFVAASESGPGIVVAQARAIADLKNSPAAQLTLLKMVARAMDAKAPEIPTE